MKIFAVVLISASVAGLAVSSFVSRSAESRYSRELAEQQARWAGEKSALEESLAKARRQPVRFEQPPALPSTDPVDGALSPEQILEKLKTLRANTRDPHSIRRVIYHLEQLREIGPGAVPAIEAFLARFEDIDYSGRGGGDDGQPDAREGRGGREGRPDFRGMGRGGRDVRLTFTTPPSLRMGLFDVLAGIGGEAAEDVLASVLAQTGKPLEVAYLSKTLQEIAPNKHGSTAVASAKDLLLNPAGGANDETSKDYLYYVLRMFNDTSFAGTAQTMIVSADGRVDRDALNYLAETLKEQAVPAIYAAYNDPRVTNQWEKASLMNLALNYTGTSPQANEMLNSVISSEDVPAPMRAMAVASLTRGDLSPETIQARIPVVEALKGSTSDERVLRALNLTEQNLHKMLAGQPADMGGLREMFAPNRGGDRGPAGRGGGRFGGRQ